MQDGQSYSLHESLVMETSEATRRHAEGETVSDQGSLDICFTRPMRELSELDVSIYPTFNHFDVWALEFSSLESWLCHEVHNTISRVDTHDHCLVLSYILRFK